MPIDEKENLLPLITAILRGEYVRVVDDPTGTPVSSVITAEDLLKYGAFASKVRAVTASGNVNLANTDPIFIEINPNGANRDVTCPAAGNDNHGYFIHHTGSANTLTVKRSGGATITTLTAGEIKYIKPSVASDFSAQTGGSFSPTITSAAIGNLIFYDGSAWRNIGGLNNGEMLNGKIAVSVASNNITVALKTRSGGDPSATDPVIVNINGTYRLITSALSVTKNAGTNWFASGSAELATKEVDYFVYLAWNTTPVTDVIDLGFARIPWGAIGSDFSTTTTNEKYLAHSNASDLNAADDVVNIGRFAATLSAGAGFTWTVPTFTNVNLKQYPIYETRSLSYAPVFTGFSVSPTVVALYTIKGKQCFFNINTTANGTSNANTFTVSLPMTSSPTANDITKDVIQFVDNGAQGTAPGLASMPANSAVTQLFKDWSGQVWTTSGNKSANFSTCYNL